MAAPLTKPTIAACDRKSIKNPNLKREKSNSYSKLSVSISKRKKEKKQKALASNDTKKIEI